MLFEALMNKCARRTMGGLMAMATAMAMALSGCGGGFYVGYCDCGGSDSPNVSLATSSASAPAGSTIQLIAAASDDYGVDQVAFYRVDGGAYVQIGVLSQTPYQIDVTLPSTTGHVDFVARASDFDGNVTQSGTVAVTVTPAF